MKKIVEVSHLSYRYNQSKERSLDDVSFSVDEGEFFAIIGSNAAGKSTLCNALVGLIPHFFVGAMAGKVMINGVDVANTNIGEISTIAGLVFQNPFNQLSYTTETVREELAYGLSNRGFSRSDMLNKIRSVSKKVSIEDLLERNPLELSGGQVQRVAFGSTYILEPKILVLDEYTTQLDPVGSEKLTEIVKQLNSEGVTIIMVDHDMNRVAKYADHILLLKDGKSKILGTPREIFTQENASRYGIELPEAVKLSHLMIKKGYWQGKVALTEEEALSMIKKVQKVCC
ncbi:energy-coupling factor ABC transporter ATP-binding protein [Enterococcus sp. 2201sp1_2201st1_B8_2201SCRN_220225]|uniref:energy-coupling factor ABC transporter ATP-binding protein n=1 Tax=unclassified Enterococcus TaxID=2608891 RepID=UPI0034A5B579